MTNTELNYIKRTLEVQKMINDTFRDFLISVQDSTSLEEVKNSAYQALLDLGTFID